MKLTCERVGGFKSAFLFYNIMEEIWKDVVGYEGIYEVSDMGNVRITKSGIIRKQNATKFGYKQIVLCLNGKRKVFLAHRLVALAFIENFENKEQVNHKNGVKMDNRLCNLEWVTRTDNAQHAIKIGLVNFDKTKGEKNYKCTIGEIAARDIKFNCARSEHAQKSFAVKYGVSISVVKNIVYGSNWKWLTE